MCQYKLTQTYRERERERENEWIKDPISKGYFGVKYLNSKLLSELPHSYF